MLFVYSITGFMFSEQGCAVLYSQLPNLLKLRYIIKTALQKARGASMFTTLNSFQLFMSQC